MTHDCNDTALRQARRDWYGNRLRITKKIPIFRVTNSHTMNQQYRNFLDRAAAILIVIAFIAASATAFVGYAAGSLMAILIGLAPSVGLTVWGIIFFMQMLREKSGEREPDVSYLIRHGERVRVSLDRLVIKSLAWQEAVRHPGTGLATDYFDTCPNFLSLDMTHRGRTIHWESAITMEPDLLRIRLAFQGQTYLYYDAKSGAMYLDLEFLQERE